MINKYSILNGVKYFSLNGLQNYLVFIFYYWNSKRMSEESIIPPSTTDASLYPEVIRLSGGK